MSIATKTMNNHHSSLIPPTNLINYFKIAYGVNENKLFIQIIDSGNRTPGKIFRFHFSKNQDFIIKPFALLNQYDWQENIHYLIDFIKFCNKEKLSVIKICSTKLSSKFGSKGCYWITDGTMVYLVFRYIMQEQKFPGYSAYCTAIGEFSAILHDTANLFHPKCKIPKFSFVQSIEVTLRLLQVPINNIQIKPKELWIALEEYRNMYLILLRIAFDIVTVMEKNCRTSHIHGDLKPDNVLWVREKQISVIDFDLCHFGSITNEFHNIIVGSEKKNPLRFDISHAEATISAYNRYSSKKITEQEKRVIQLTVVARFAERFAVTFKLPNSPFYFLKDSSQTQARIKEYQLINDLVKWSAIKL